MRKVLCTILPLVIPKEEIRKTNSISKSGIAMALGFNDKSLIGNDKSLREVSNFTMQLMAALM